MERCLCSWPNNTKIGPSLAINDIDLRETHASTSKIN